MTDASREERPQYQLAVGKEEALKTLRELRASFQRGEITCATLRIFKPDGNWEDRVIGGDLQQRAQALSDLDCVARRAN